MAKIDKRIKLSEDIDKVSSALYMAHRIERQTKLYFESIAIDELVSKSSGFIDTRPLKQFSESIEMFFASLKDIDMALLATHDNISNKLVNANKPRK